MLELENCHLPPISVTKYLHVYSINYLPYLQIPYLTVLQMNRLLRLHPKFNENLYLLNPSKDIEWTVLNMKKDNDYQQNMKKGNDYEHTMSPIKQD